MKLLIDNYTTPPPSGISKATVTTTRESPWLSREYTSTVLSSTFPPGLNDRIKKLLSEYERLKDNWDGDDALAPRAEVIKKAFRLTSILEKHGQQIFHAAPGPNGEIMMDLRDKTKSSSIEIIFYQNRDVVVYF